MYMRALSDALTAQRALIGKLRVELPESAAAARAKAAEMCHELAEQFKLDRRFEQVRMAADSCWQQATGGAHPVSRCGWQRAPAGNMPLEVRIL